MRTYIFIFFAIFTIHSCSSPQNRIETSDSTTFIDSVSVVGSTKIVDSKVAVKEKKPVLFKGLYTFGNEVRTFRDCNGSQPVYWVNDSIASLRDKYEKTNRFPSYPYESVYAEVRGYLSGKSSLGYASEYEKVLVVTEIVKLEAKNFRTDCYQYEFIALGNEPFWSLEIIPSERRIVFKNVGQEKALEFIYAPAKVEAGVHRYEATSRSNAKLVVEIRQEKCSDGMSERKYNFSSKVTLNGKVYRGCAIKKGDVFTRDE